MADSSLPPAGHPTDRLVGTSSAMAALRAQIRHLAPFDSLGSPVVPTLMLQGETGTGKGLVARIIHDSGPRGAGPFIEVNCAAIPVSMLEAELFGFEAGAFTDAKRAKPGLFEAAVGGVLLLDEVDALPLALQGKLLTAIETKRVRRLGAVAERAVDVKLIAATNAALEQRVATGHFRADLYHRLAVVVLALPSLRTLGEDVLVLAQTFLQLYTAAHGVPPKRLSAGAEAWLARYAWPGNVRELMHLIERVTLLHVGEAVEAETLTQLCLPLTARAASGEVAWEAQAPEPARLEPPEAVQIRQALAQSGGNVARAARLLGVSRDTVRYRMQRYGIPRPRPDVLPVDERGGAGLSPTSLAPRSWRPSRRRRAQAPQEAAGGQASAREEAGETQALPPGPAWEHKPVVVLALELTWPAMSGLEPIRSDPWTTAAHWEQALQEKVQGFGGLLLQGTAGVRLWVFGLPQALEQLPHRAVHSALAIRQMVADTRASDLAPCPEVRLAVHLGAVRRDRQAAAPTAPLLAVGDTMARPVRLLGQAGPGEVVVSPEVGRLVEGWVALEGRVGGYAVLGVRSRRNALASRGTPRSPFVGRTRELALLEAILEQVQAGQGQVVGLMGMPGIGKSRLLEEFRRSLADKRVTYLEARCLAYGSAVPYLAVRALLQDHCGISETDGPEAMTEKVRLALQELDMDPEEGGPYLLHLLGVPLGTERLAGLRPKALKARTFEILQQLSLHGS
jgi:DNA-binding NtrC family response regulator